MGAPNRTEGFKPGTEVLYVDCSHAPCEVLAATVLDKKAFINSYANLSGFKVKACRPDEEAINFHSRMDEDGDGVFDAVVVNDYCIARGDLFPLTLGQMVFYGPKAVQRDLKEKPSGRLGLIANDKICDSGDTAVKPLTTDGSYLQTVCVPNEFVSPYFGKKDWNHNR